MNLVRPTAARRLAGATVTYLLATLAVLLPPLVWPVAAQAQPAGSTYVPAALSEQAAPSGSGNFHTFTTPAINQSGHIVFTAGLSGAEITSDNDSGIWSGRPGSLDVVAREGSTAPVADPDVHFGDFPITIIPDINSQGKVLFRNDMTGPNVTTNNSQSLWIGPAGGITLLARAGTETAPGTSDTYFGFGSPEQVNNSASAAFHAQLTGGGFGVWSGQQGNLAKLAQTGDPVPGTTDTIAFNIFGNTPAVNSNGTVAFLATQFTGPGVRDPIFDGGIFSGTPGSVQLIARRGDPAPSSSGANFNLFLSEPGINDAGTVVFSSQLSNSSIGIFAGKSAANLIRVARTGQVAPGTGGLFYASFGIPVIGGGGDVAFSGMLSGGSWGVWVGIPNPAESEPVHLVARTGDAAPMTSGATFNILSTPVVNANGQVAFRGTLNSDNSDYGVFAIDPFGQLVKVIRTGEAVPLGPSGSAIVTDFAFSAGSGGQDGKPMSFNDSSQLALRVTLNNGSVGLYVARVGGAARIETGLPLAGFGPESGPTLVIGGSESEGYTPATADVSSNIGYVRFLGIQESAADVFVYLKIVGTANGVTAVTQELATGAAAYGYTVEQVSPAGILAGFNILLKFAHASNGGTQTFYWNLANINGADIAAVAIVPEPAVQVLLLFTISLAAGRRRGKSSPRGVSASKLPVPTLRSAQ